VTRQHTSVQITAISLLVLLVMVLTLMGCANPANGPTAQASQTLITVLASPTSTPTRVPASATPSPQPTATSSPTASPTPTLTPRAFTVAIDPGHGGVDLGARRFGDDGRMIYHESTVNLELGLLTRDALLTRGFHVVMIRETDRLLNEEELDVSGDGIFEYTQDEMQARVDYINASDADLILSIHHNAYLDSAGRGVGNVGGIQTFYCADRPFGDDSYRFAMLVHEALTTAIRDYGYDINDRGVLDDRALVTPDSTGAHLILLGPQSARIVRPSQVPGALSEPMFITHAVEGDLARDPVLQKRLAAAYADAVEAYVDGIQP
jgi:N-acetylmuramoyl-L-alanine amidase